MPKKPLNSSSANPSSRTPTKSTTKNIATDSLNNSTPVTRTRSQAAKLSENVTQHQQNIKNLDSDKKHSVDKDAKTNNAMSTSSKKGTQSLEKSEVLTPRETRSKAKNKSAIKSQGKSDENESPAKEESHSDKKNQNQKEKEKEKDTGKDVSQENKATKEVKEKSSTASKEKKFGERDRSEENKETHKKEEQAKGKGTLNEINSPIKESSPVKTRSTRKNDNKPVIISEDEEEPIASKGRKVTKEPAKPEKKEKDSFEESPTTEFTVEKGILEHIQNLKSKVNEEKILEYLGSRFQDMNEEKVQKMLKKMIDKGSLLAKNRNFEVPKNNGQERGKKSVSSGFKSPNKDGNSIMTRTTRRHDKNKPNDVIVIEEDEKKDEQKADKKEEKKGKAPAKSEKKEKEKADKDKRDSLPEFPSMEAEIEKIIMEEVESLKSEVTEEKILDHLGSKYQEVDEEKVGKILKRNVDKGSLLLKKGHYEIPRHKEEKYSPEKESSGKRTRKGLRTSEKTTPAEKGKGNSKGAIEIIDDEENEWNPGNEGKVGKETSKKEEVPTRVTRSKAKEKKQENVESMEVETPSKEKSGGGEVEKEKMEKKKEAISRINKKQRIRDYMRRLQDRGKRKVAPNSERPKVVDTVGQNDEGDQEIEVGAKIKLKNRVRIDEEENKTDEKQGKRVDLIEKSDPQKEKEEEIAQEQGSGDPSVPGFVGQAGYTGNIMQTHPIAEGGQGVSGEKVLAVDRTFRVEKKEPEIDPEELRAQQEKELKEKEMLLKELEAEYIDPEAYEPYKVKKIKHDHPVTAQTEQAEPKNDIIIEESQFSD